MHFRYSEPILILWEAPGRVIVMPQVLHADVGLSRHAVALFGADWAYDPVIPCAVQIIVFPGLDNIPCRLFQGVLLRHYNFIVVIDMFN